MRQIVRDIPFTDVEADSTAFLVMRGIPLTCSISSGIGLGLIAPAVVRTVRWSGREVHPLLGGITAAITANFAVPWINPLRG